MRPTWKGFLKLSLVNIPVRLYPAARSKSLSFHQLHQLCRTRIKYDKRCPTCNRSVTNDEIIKAYEYGKDQYVILAEEDFEKVRLESTKSIHIVQFVAGDEIDPLYYHGSHYIVPDGPVAIEAFTTVREAMRQRDRLAIAKVVMSNKEQVVALRPRDRALVMSALYYGDEVRGVEAIEELSETAEIQPQELTLATQLIEQLTRPFDPTAFEDEYRKKLLEIIKAKAEGREIVEPPQVETGKVINLMDALKSSLEREAAPGQELEATGTETSRKRHGRSSS